MSSVPYAERVKRHTPRSPVIKNCCFAFLVGGGICAAGQGLFLVFVALGSPERAAYAWVSITLIALAALLTGLGIFDRLARIGGAGTLVPITGFSNAVVSPALDTKAEGFILGVGAKIFTVAGPVILYGELCGVLYGVILWLVQGLGGAI